MCSWRASFFRCGVTSQSEALNRNGACAAAEQDLSRHNKQSYLEVISDFTFFRRRSNCVRSASSKARVASARAVLMAEVAVVPTVLDVSCLLRGR